jgi:hypothetical protein
MTTLRRLCRALPALLEIAAVIGLTLAWVLWFLLRVIDPLAAP